MVALRVPSLQHMARNWRDSPEGVCRELVRLANNSPTFSYNPLFSAVRDLLVFKQPYVEVEQGIRRGVKRATVRDNLLGVLPLIERHFRDEDPAFVQQIAPRVYAAGRGLLIPFAPPMICQVGGQLKFPWFSFWRSNPLARERLALFVACVRELLEQDPDLEDARFQILDFSVPKGEIERELIVLEADDIPTITDERKREMLEIFGEGLVRARAELAQKPSKKDDHRDRDRDPDWPPDHPDLFD